MKCWSVFENRYMVYINKQKTWLTELCFYCGDMSNIDLSSDSRFKKVKDRRDELKFLGLYSDGTFPVIFPLMLDNEKVLYRNDYHTPSIPTED